MEVKPDEGMRVMNRARMLSKSKAMSASHSVMMSQLGAAVIKNYSTENVVRRQNMRRLDMEKVWFLRELDKSTQQIISRRDRLPVPILIVERPPAVSLAAVLAATGVQGSPQSRLPAAKREAYSGCPGYMRPTLRTAHVLPVISSTDAFIPMKSRMYVEPVYTAYLFRIYLLFIYYEFVLKVHK